MTAELTTLKVAYEEEGMSPEEIASDRGLDVAAVKAGLMQVSAKYRKDCGKEEETKDDLNFSDDHLRRVNEVIYDLALSSEDEHLRFKAATYIRDDKKGRKEVAKSMGGNNFNILMLNEQLAKVREVGDRIKKQLLPAPGNQGEPINV